MKIFFTLIIALSGSILFGQIQNVRFSYDISNGGTTVNYYAHTTTGTANLAGFNFGFYYNDPEATSPVLDVSPASTLGWATSGNFTQTSNVGTYVVDGTPYNRFLEMQLIDGNGAGSNMTTSPVLVATITFNIGTGPSATSGGNVRIAETSTSGAGAFVIYDNAFNPADVVAEGVLTQVLPIKLSKFTVDKFGDKKASNLRWTSSSEINASHFEIERSSNGYDFEYLSSVNAQGNSNWDINYQYIDDKLPYSRTAQNIYYYRLKMVDLDGQYEYSEVRSVRFDESDEITITYYPNPTTERIFLNMSIPAYDNSIETTATIFDMSGKLIMTKKVSTNGITEIDLSDLPNAAFNVNVEHNGKVYTNRVIKTN
ncbi:MAG: T9SS type A sorting domain-containing protein [Saprospiraceae bacterium]|nr:T9SS type A sorting domain-containing protein [Saprospiraceae bacterium]